MQGKRFRFGEYEADLGLQELRKCGTRVGLQHKPFHVLELLLCNPGQLVTRQQLFDHLWPDSHVSYERGLNSAVNSLRQVLGESSRQCHYIETRQGEAYQDYLKGRYLLDRMAEDDTHKALAYFHSAATDATCQPLAQAGMADAYCRLALIDSVCSSRVCAQARTAAESALRADPDLAHAHVSHARVKMLFDWDWNGTREALARALTLDPASVPARIMQSSFLCALGQYDAARESCGQALLADPLSFPANLQMAACEYASGHFQAAVNQCWTMLSLASSFSPAQLLLALSYQQLGMYAEAVVEFQNARLCSACRVPATGGLSCVLALAGSETESERAYQELSDLAGQRYVSGYWHAVVLAGRNDFASALSHLEDSVMKRDVAPLWLRSDARFGGMRESARFQQLLNHFA
jgi:tetratricopeptide (TPR) repeat protein